MPLPKWLQRLSNATIKAAIAENPAVATASGWTINNKTGEAQQNATEDPGVQQLRENLAILGGTATGITAAPLVTTSTAAKLVGKAAASMLGGETVDQIHRGITGQSFGRGMASLLGQQNVYDRSALSRFGYDALNPGYFAGSLINKGVNAGINTINKLKPSTIKDIETTWQKAIDAGDINSAQKMRDLHFKRKAIGNKLVDQNGNPHKVWHGSPEDWNVFDNLRRGVDDVIYFSTDKSYADQFTIPKKTWSVGMKPTKHSRSFYLYGKEPINIGTDMYSDATQTELRNAWMNKIKADSVYGLDYYDPNAPLKQSNGIEFGILKRSQAKLTDPITFDDSGNIIPLSKRDNFNNPDIRYSKGVFTRRNPDYYVGKPKDLMWDFNKGRRTAWGYLGSQRKATTDIHNKDILTRITNDPTNFRIEQLPQQRAMTPMQKPQAGMQMNDGEWINLGDNGFFLYKGKGNEAGLTFRVKGAPEKDQMYLTTDFDMDDTAFHEYLHRGNMGVGFNGPTQWLYNWKNRSILKPGFENFRDGYLTNPEETAVNLLEIGRRADILNTPYPGPEKAKSIIKTIIRDDLEKGSILAQTKWETKPKRVWDALQGKYMGLVPLGVGSGLMIYKEKNE